MSLRIKNIYIPDKDASCQSWELYYNELLTRFGEQKAREYWLYTFSKRGNSSCTKDKGFNDWAADNKIAVADGLDKTVAGVANVGHNILSGAGTLTSIVPKLGVVLLAGTVATVLYLMFRISKETNASELVEMIPAGKALKAGKLLK